MFYNIGLYCATDLFEIKTNCLQTYYGDPNGIKIIDSSRNYIKEENMCVLEGNLEIKVLVYFLSDLLVLCEPDEKSETKYKLFKHVLLNSLT